MFPDCFKNLDIIKKKLTLTCFQTVSKLFLNCENIFIIIYYLSMSFFINGDINIILKTTKIFWVFTIILHLSQIYKIVLKMWIIKTSQKSNSIAQKASIAYGEDSSVGV